jgi:hypothetical protein
MFDTAIYRQRNSTFNAHINLNAGVKLRRRDGNIRLPPSISERSGRTGVQMRTASGESGKPMRPVVAQPPWAEFWHLWWVIIPRRSITGRLVYGQTWRRHDGHHWIYKKFTEYVQDIGE